MLLFNQQFAKKYYAFSSAPSQFPDKGNETPQSTTTETPEEKQVRVVDRAQKEINQLKADNDNVNAARIQNVLNQLNSALKDRFEDPAKVVERLELRIDKVLQHKEVIAKATPKPINLPEMVIEVKPPDKKTVEANNSRITYTPEGRPVVTGQYEESTSGKSTEIKGPEVTQPS